MNKKRKLLLPTVGLVVLSGIAATSTTFAWFTTVRSASVEVTRAKVVTTDSNLVIAPAHTWNDNLTATSSGGGDDPVELKYSGDALVTDISGDGKTFFKPVWAVAPSKAASFKNVTPTVAGDGLSADGYLIDFTIKISRGAGDTVEGLKVYLGANTKFKPIAAAGDQKVKDELAIAGARMSVYESNASGELGEKIFVHSPEEEPQATNSNYLAIDAGGTAYQVSGYAVKTDLDVKHAAFTTGATIAAAEADYPYIAYLAGSEVGANDRVEDAFVNFRIWIEGTDKDTINSMIEGEFDVDLDIYALPYNAGV